MDATSTPTPGADSYELRYSFLFNEGRALVFPCDAQGHVDLDGLSERARNNYFYARAVAGRDLSWPALQRRVLH